MVCEKQAKALFQFSALLSARVRERRPAFCFCQKAALWCGCALSWGKADLRRTAKTALERTIRSLRGALDLGSLRRPSRPPAVEIPIHFVESDIYLGLNEVDGDFYSGVNVTDDAASKIRSQHSLFSGRRR